MDTKTRPRVVVKQSQDTKEYSVTVDGVIQVPTNLKADAFFDDLLDAIINYVESRKAFAGLGMSFKEYIEDDDKAINGGST